jgi:hypothetical protein
MVKLENIIAVSGQAALFKLVANRNNGLLLEDLDTGKTNFYSARTHQFSPLESIGIYTLSDTVPLTEVYDRFLKEENVPLQNVKDEELKSFFLKTVPEYDRYKVYPKDMKKCVKWFHQMKSYGLILKSEITDEVAKKEEE